MIVVCDRTKVTLYPYKKTSERFWENVFFVLTVLAFCLSAAIKVCKSERLNCTWENSRLEPTYGRFLRYFEGWCHVWTETKSTFFIFNPVFVKIHEGLLYWFLRMWMAMHSLKYSEFVHRIEYTNTRPAFPALGPFRPSCRKQCTYL